MCHVYLLSCGIFVLCYAGATETTTLPGYRACNTCHDLDQGRQHTAAVCGGT